MMVVAMVVAMAAAITRGEDEGVVKIYLKKETRR
jgi:pyruvate/2-oxoglutarate dehydrogenase complex dihydrolipoamide dehydrogenase (E3) component